MKKIPCIRLLFFAFTLSLSTDIFPTEPPIMGWSSWNTYRVNINETLIKKQADAMVATGLKEAGYRYINIDDGYFGFRDDKGTIHSHSQRFPNGMKPIVDYIHAKGLKAGIYSEAGTNTCGAMWDNDTHGIGVGMYGHEANDAELFFNKWGFDFIKIDYCGGQQLELDEKERYSTIIKTINETSHKKIAVNVCRWAYPGTWVKDLAASWRISPDIYPDWKAIKHIIEMNLYLSAYAGDGHYNDMDMLEIGRGLSQTEEETHFGMWCIMSSPLMIGCDLTDIPQESLKLLKNKELISINQDKLGLQAYVVQHKNGGYVLVKDIEKRHGNVRAVALYNPSDTICHFNVPLKLLEFEGKVKVRDLIRQKDENPAKEYLDFNVAPHGVKILKIEGEKRIERTIYEAEDAYLNRYNALGECRSRVIYMEHNDASGGIVVSKLGGTDDNYAEWDNIFSTDGGDYIMKISYIPVIEKERFINDCKIEVVVNDEMHVLDKLETDRKKGFQIAELKVKLKKGDNKIRIGSRLTWTPDIDYISLEQDN